MGEEWEEVEEDVYKCGDKTHHCTSELCTLREQSDIHMSCPISGKVYSTQCLLNKNERDFEPELALQCNKRIKSVERKTMECERELRKVFDKIFPQVVMTKQALLERVKKLTDPLKTKAVLSRKDVGFEAEEIEHWIACTMELHQYLGGKFSTTQVLLGLLYCASLENGLILNRVVRIENDAHIETWFPTQREMAKFTIRNKDVTHGHIALHRMNWADFPSIRVTQYQSKNVG